MVYAPTRIIPIGSRRQSLVYCLHAYYLDDTPSPGPPKRTTCSRPNYQVYPVLLVTDVYLEQSVCSIRDNWHKRNSPFFLRTHITDLTDLRYVVWLRGIKVVELVFGLSCWVSTWVPLCNQYHHQILKHSLFFLQHCPTLTCCSVVRPLRSKSSMGL